MGRASEFTREWAYTSLSRARERTRVYLVAEATSGQREREQYAPPEPVRTRAEALETMARAMTRREAEPLAVQQTATPCIPAVDRSASSLAPHTATAEADGQHAVRSELAGPLGTVGRNVPKEPDWRTLRRTHDRGHDRGMGHER